MKKTESPALVDPMTVEWPRDAFAVGMEVMIKPSDKDHAVRCGIDITKPQTISRDDGSRSECAPFHIEGRDTGCFEPVFLVPLSKVQAYQAALAAQKGTMNPAIKAVKETIAEQALREAMEKVKAAQEREAGIRAILAIDAKMKANREAYKALTGERAELAAKWLPKAGKVRK